MRVSAALALYSSLIVHCDAFANVGQLPARTYPVRGLCAAEINTPCKLRAAAVDFGAPPAIVERELRGIKSAATKFGMIAFITSMCVALPASIGAVRLLELLRIIDSHRRERLSLKAASFCARWLMRLIPFAKIDVIAPERENGAALEEPAVWVCNHISMLDIFFMLAKDQELRGRNCRPLKIIYWKTLENNPVNKIFFKSCGFIPVEMSDNKDKANEYNMSSFKILLRMAKKAFEDGFDLGILPEGQLNPNPEKGLMPIFSGAYTLARMSRRPIRMMALHGTNHMWHADDAIGMDVSGRRVRMRRYPHGRNYGSADEFAETFKKVAGQFGATGKDLPERELEMWLDGSRWAEMEGEKVKNVPEGAVPL